MEKARQTSLWAQQLKVHCDQLCAKSREDTERMHLDVKQHLELRIRDKKFWIKELEQRNTSAKQMSEDLEAAQRQLDKAAETCKRFLGINHECIKCREEKFPDADAVAEHLHEETRTLLEGHDAIKEDTKRTKTQKQVLEQLSKDLDWDIANKYEALRTDEKSISLKHYQFQTDAQMLARGDAPGVTVKLVGRTASPQIERNVDEFVKTADNELKLGEQLLKEVSHRLRSSTKIISSQIDAVNEALQQDVVRLRKEKSDLEHHLDMTNAHMDATDQTTSQVIEAIEEKETAIRLSRERLSLHYARPTSELSVDGVQQAITKELAENLEEIGQMSDQIPALEATLRSLRRARLEIERRIAGHVGRIETEEIGCMGMRIAMLPITL